MARLIDRSILQSYPGSDATASTNKFTDVNVESRISKSSDFEYFLNSQKLKGCLNQTEHGIVIIG